MDERDTQMGQMGRDGVSLQVAKEHKNAHHVLMKRAAKKGSGNNMTLTSMGWEKSEIVGSKLDYGGNRREICNAAHSTRHVTYTRMKREKKKK